MVVKQSKSFKKREMKELDYVLSTQLQDSLSLLHLKVQTRDRGTAPEDFFERKVYTF